MSNTQQAERQKILELAKQGNPKIIAALLNRQLQLRGITAKVALKNSCLYIVLESDTDAIPEERPLVEFIRQAMTKLKAEGFKTLKVCGRIREEEIPVWMREIVLDHNIEPITEQKRTVEILKSKSEEGLSAWLKSGTTVIPWESENLAIENNQRFLRFHLGFEDTALLPLDSIKEVLRVSAAEILPVPHMPDCVLGIYNWRGEMLWTIDLNNLLGFPSLSQSQGMLVTSTTKNVALVKFAIALQVGNQVLGLVVQQVDEIEEHNWQKLQSPNPGLFSPKLLPFVQGYLTEASSIVLDARSIVQSPLWQKNLE